MKKKSFEIFICKIVCFCFFLQKGLLRVWDIKSKRMICSFDAKLKVRCVDFNPDGTKIAIGSAEGDVVLYRISNDFKNLEKLDVNRQRKAVIADVK